MTYPFHISQQNIFEFEDLLKEQNISVEKDSDLERIMLAILEANGKYQKEIEHNEMLDIRTSLAEVAGLVDFIHLILKNKDHQSFSKLIPHLKLLNNADSAVMTTKSRVTDAGNNKLFELYIALICMSFAAEVDLDDPNSSKGDNPDIMFTDNGIRWAIACKALHANKERTLYDTLEKGTEQINRSSAEKGIVMVNFKNINDYDRIWPIVNKEKFIKGEKPLFNAFDSIEQPLQQLNQYSLDLQVRLKETIGEENLVELSTSGKTPPGFIAFFHAVTSVKDGENTPLTLLKTLNFVQFGTVDIEYLALAEKLNLAMHNMMPSLTEIAYHEAGHAVTAHIIYELVMQCSIVPTVEDGVYYLGFTEFDRPLNIVARDPIKEFDFKFLLKLLICNHAGRYFERSVAGRDNEQMASIDRLQMQLYTSDEAIAIFEILQDEILHEFCRDTPIQNMVEVIANELLEKKSLNYHDIRALLSSYPFDFLARIDELAATYYPRYTQLFDQNFSNK